jgi:hypothetical protein
MSDPQPKYTATMMLPKGGKQAWTNIMQGATSVPDDIETGSPIVMATAIFEDGTWVAGGVLKGDSPAEYNIIFMWVFDINGNKYPRWPIDVGDVEDFFLSAIYFSLPGGEDDEYLLKIVEVES